MGFQWTKLKLKPIWAFKYIVQLAFFFVYITLFSQAFSGMKRIYQMTVKGEFNLLELPLFITPLFIVVILSILLGRFFCGWLCSFGTLTDILYFISFRLIKKTFQVYPEIDRWLRYLKYLVLLFIVVLAWTLELDFLKGKSPWDAFSQIGHGIQPIILSPWSYGILLAILISSLFIERLFCRYLCPLGAFMSLISFSSLIKIRKPKKDCGNCSVCTALCPVGLQLHKTEHVTSGDCIRCLKCTEECPQKTPHFSFNSFSYVLLALFIFIMIFSTNRLYDAYRDIDQAQQQTLSQTESTPNSP